ncbi:HEAT repeat domain-containing protein [Hymenobacter sp. NST-14]|uniref:HEAT repeat domain-containing protein n=1 Tax=Hymenobacter piscis TaxID=2839984 RepID=UPI001C03004D|nr:HEAT repeat domain-containing protein [Hymenobacter piscis]MBT9394987.1 HEAT repeat domain-containing protein [Hymenobacter piscis]
MAALPAHPAELPECPALRPLLPAFVEQELPASDSAAVAAHLPRCPACRQQVQQLRTLLHALDDEPLLLPPPTLRDALLAAIAHEKQHLPASAATPAETPRPGRVLPLWEASPAGAWLRVAASVALLAMGMVLGLLLRPGQPEVARQPAPDSGVAARLTAAMVQSAPASRRLSLVSAVPAEVQPGDPAVQVLITLLNADPNPNVRLAAAEALFQLRTDPRVGPALVQALPNQTDPNVQLTLIELLTTLRDKRAVAPLEQLARQPGVLPPVRQQAERGLGLLI